MFHLTAIKANLTQDAGLKYTPTGRPVANLKLAHNERVQDDKGNWTNGAVIFFEVRVWGAKGEAAAELTKGQTVLVSLANKLPEARAWIDKNGQPQAQIVYTAADVAAVVKPQKEENPNGEKDPFTQ